MTSKAKAMTLKKKFRKGQIKPIDGILYCISVIVLFTFILFTVSLSIEEHSKRNLQVESTVTHLEDFDSTNPSVFILENSLMDDLALEPPLVFSPLSPHEATEGKDIVENTIVKKDTSDIISKKDKSSDAYRPESNSIVSTTKEENLIASTLEDNFIVPVTEYEIGLIVQAVQHEVGAWEDFYPDADLDEVQQIMARVIINQVGLPDSGDSIYDVLFLHPGHFMPIEELEGIDPYEERTRRNVLKVLRGEDSHSSKVTIEMSFSRSCTFEDSIEVMESQVGPVNPYFWTITAEGRLLMFAEPA